MNKFVNKIKNIIGQYNNTAMFIDMDGTLLEYKFYTEEEFEKESGNFENGEPLQIVIDKLQQINDFNNIDLYILSLSKNTKIVKEKETWLLKHIPFIKRKNWIILNKEANDYNKENRDRIKTEVMVEKLKEYEHIIFLDDDHKILRTAKDTLKSKIDIFHISSALIK